MGARTEIEWADATWNPVMGCTPVSEACDNCYARNMIRRFGGKPGWPNEPGAVTLYPERLEIPARWKRPRRVFVCSMSDLFHEDVPFEFVHEVYERMAVASRHTFMLLTKRPERMRAFFDWERGQCADEFSIFHNVWLGVTAENQKRADERIPALLDTPAAVRFVSVEPMLGAVDLTRWLAPRHKTGVCYYGVCEWAAGDSELDWIIVGGETGAGARLMRASWVADIERQCEQADVPLFFKKWGDAARSGDDASEAWRMGHESEAPHGGHKLPWYDERRDAKLLHREELPEVRG